MKNLVPQDYQKGMIVTRLNGTYYLAKKCGSTWNVGRLEGAKVIPMTEEPKTPWILIEYGEYLQYEKYERVLAFVPYAEVRSFLKGCQS